MEKILIVQNNKQLAKLLAKKIEESLGFEIDIAYKFSEAKLFLKAYKYFLTIVDIDLPDAQNGEMVDYALKKENKVIVLGKDIDKELRKEIVQKNIIDYINKGDIDDINYILYTIQRLQKNQKHTILVVDDSMVFRKTMKNMLENLFYKVVTVAHGEEALNTISIRSDISLVITDYNMPVMNGLELTKEIRKEHDRSDMCIIAISSNNDDEVNALFLKQGANDYIKKPFSKEEFSCRINNSIEALENIQLITNHANRDFLTGLYNRRYFFNNANKYMQEIHESAENFTIAMIDIDFFKKINDTYGHDVGDDIIVSLSEILRANTNYKDIVSRFAGEEFCILLKDTDKIKAGEILERLRVEVENFTYITADEKTIKFTISIGASMNEGEELDEIINQADMMLYNAKQNGRNQVRL
jgi:diguanylate cyclase (GGDEF)-like protein